MTPLDMTALDTALDALPQAYPGPGGVAGVVKDGKVIATRAWGYRNLDTRAPMTTGTRLPICSISKQFTCGVLLDQLGAPEALDGKLGAFLPAFTGEMPKARDLCNNQSGLRDYWALTVTHGALAEQTFARGDALPMIARMKTGHFAPGTRYSYCNCNFRIISELIEQETGRPLDELYREVIWDPAGMETTVLTADTRHPEDGVVAYEGAPGVGYFPADNGIYWIGDAGISASLDDMLAYEAWIDATRDDPDSLYRRLSERQAFRDGAPAWYGFGLVHETIGGRHVTGHGGALRGIRANRLHVADERLSVMVHFNHEGDAHAAAQGLIKAALGVETPAGRQVDAGWKGQWLCPETGLLTRVDPALDGALLKFTTGAAKLVPGEDGTLSSPGMRAALDGETLSLTVVQDNIAVEMPPLPVVTAADGSEIAGRYHSVELEADMVIEARDGGVYGVFEGLLGQGRMERIHPAGPDVWALVTRRSMDAPAPGEWTIRVTRGADGAVSGLVLGCWLARGIEYAKAG